MNISNVNKDILTSMHVVIDDEIKVIDRFLNDINDMEELIDENVKSAIFMLRKRVFLKLRKAEINHNPLKLISPFYRTRVKEIDNKLDLLELELFNNKEKLGQLRSKLDDNRSSLYEKQHKRRYEVLESDVYHNKPKSTTH